MSNDKQESGKDQEVVLVFGFASLHMQADTHKDAWSVDVDNGGMLLRLPVNIRDATEPF